MKSAELFVPNFAELEELHRGDWPIGSNGGFRKIVFTMDRSSPRHQYAFRLAQLLAARTVGVEAIYFRGSALESARSEWVRDLDLVVVASSDAMLTQREVKEIVGEFRRENPSELRVDVGVMGVSAVLASPFTSVKQLILAFRALRLSGREVWPESPLVQPDVDLARACFIAHTEPTWQRLATVAQDPAKHFQDPLVSWVQKRALRAGGILAMGRIGRFSRHPVRCAELVGLMFPDLAVLAANVVHDYCAGDRHAHAWQAAVNLFDELRVRGNLLLFVHG